MKTEIFDKIINLVAETTELKKECILSSCKTDDLVAARCLFVHFCAANVAKRNDTKKSDNMEDILFNMLFYDNVTDYEFWRNASQWMM